MLMYMKGSICMIFWLPHATRFLKSCLCAEIKYGYPPLMCLPMSFMGEFISVLLPDCSMFKLLGLFNGTMCVKHVFNPSIPTVSYFVIVFGFGVGVFVGIFCMLALVGVEFS